MPTQHILLAEGRTNLQYSLGLMLKQANYRVSIASTTEEGMAMAKTLQNTPEAVDLLIADLDSASSETCSAFLHTLSASTLAIPYLVLAEEICGQTADALKRHGCLACITKPFEPETLLRNINDALTRLSAINKHQTGRASEKSSSRNAANG